LFPFVFPYSTFNSSVTLNSVLNVFCSPTRPDTEVFLVSANIQPNYQLEIKPEQQIQRTEIKGNIWLKIIRNN